MLARPGYLWETDYSEWVINDFLRQQRRLIEVVRPEIANSSRQRGTSTVDLSSRRVPTELIDLTGVSMAELRICDESALAPSLDRVLRQVERPRANINESGPPGRVD